MKVEQLMSRPVITCRSEESLQDAASRMWEHDCGSLPVVDDAMHVVGMITDRDICMAAMTRGATLPHMSVGSAMSQDVYGCRPNDDVEEAETTMSRRQVHRLPVIDESEAIAGMLTVNDIARECSAGSKKKKDLKLAIDAVAAISKPRTGAIQAAE